MADVYVYAHDNRRGGWAIRDRRGSSVLEEQTNTVARMMEIPRLPVVRHLKTGGYWLVLFKPTDPPRSAGGEDTWEGKVHVLRLSDAEYRAVHYDPFRVLQDHLPPAALSPSFSGIAEAREPRGELPRRRIRAEDPGYLRYAYAFFKKLPDDVRRQTYWSVTTPSEACGDHCVFTLSRDGEPFDEVRLANLHFDGRPLPHRPVVVPDPEPPAKPTPQPSLRDSALRRAPTAMTTTNAGSVPDETIAAVFSRVQALEIKVRELADQQDRLTDQLTELHARLDDDAAVLGEGGDGDEAVKQATSATARAVRDLRKEVAELKKRSRSSVAPPAGGGSGRWPWLALGLGITAVAAVAWGMTRSGGGPGPEAGDELLTEDGMAAGDGSGSSDGAPARPPQGETNIDTGGAGVFIPPPADPLPARPSVGTRPRPSSGGGGPREPGGGAQAGATREEAQPAAGTGTATAKDGPAASSDPFEEKL